MNPTMKSRKQKTPLNVDEVARIALSEHGYLLQHKCLEEVREKTDKWFIEAEEYPVSTTDEETTIDFILRCTDFTDYYFIFECKRAHPDHVTWLFANIRKKPTTDDFVATEISRTEILAFSKTGQPVNVAPVRIPFVAPKTERKVFKASVGLEVASETKVNKRSSKSQTIREACKQVMTGVGGIVSERASLMRKTSECGYWTYVPIVVTTAKLLVSYYAAENISLRTGQIEQGMLNAKEVGWVYYDFPVNREFYKIWFPDDYLGPDPVQLQRFKTSSVFIVTSSHLVNLLNTIWRVLV